MCVAGQADGYSKTASLEGDDEDVFTRYWGGLQGQLQVL